MEKSSKVDPGTVNVLAFIDFADVQSATSAMFALQVRAPTCSPAATVAPAGAGSSQPAHRLDAFLASVVAPPRLAAARPLLYGRTLTGVTHHCQHPIQRHWTRRRSHLGARTVHCKCVSD